MAMLPPDPMFVLQGNELSITSLCFHKLESIECLLAGTQNGIMHIWNLQTNRLIEEVEICKDSILAIHSLDESTLFIQIKGGIYEEWNQEDKKWVKRKQKTYDYYGFCKSIISNSSLFVPLKDSNISYLDLENYVTKGTFSSDGLGEVMCMKYSQTNELKYLTVGYESGDISFWNCETYQKILSVKIFDDSVMALDIDEVSMKGIIAGTSDIIKIISFYKFDFKILKEIKLSNAGIACVCIRPDKRIFATGGWDGKLRLYSWKTFVSLAVLDSHIDTVQDVSFSLFPIPVWNCKCILAGGSKDGNISLWNLYNK